MLRRHREAVRAADEEGAGLNFTKIDPIKALFWSAVINGVVAAPVMAMMMLMGSKRAAMGRFVLSRGLKIVGWVATLVMTVATLAMFVTMIKPA